MATQSNSSCKCPDTTLPMEKYGTNKMKIGLSPPKKVIENLKLSLDLNWMPVQCEPLSGYTDLKNKTN